MSNSSGQEYELYDVTDFEVVGEYTIKLVFDDQTEQITNFVPILSGPMFGPLRNLTLFNQVTLDHNLGTLVWPTGVDIDPTVLHDWPDYIDTIVERRRKLFAIPS